MRLICIQLVYSPSPTPLLRQKNSLFPCNLMSLDKKEGERGNVWLPWPPAASQIPQTEAGHGGLFTITHTPEHEWFQVRLCGIRVVPLSEAHSRVSAKRAEDDVQSHHQQTWFRQLAWSLGLEAPGLPEKEVVDRLPEWKLEKVTNE